MKCFLAGGTGVIGRRVVPLLVAAGHDVTVLSRSEQADRIVHDLDARSVRADLFDRDDMVSVVSGHDVVINLATSIPPIRRSARRSAWTTNDRIRTEGVANLVAAARSNDVERYVQESITFNYLDGGDSWIGEDHACTTTGVGEPVASAEARVAEFTDGGGNGTVLRFGQFYDVESDHTRSQVAMLRRRINPFIGDPAGYTSFIGVPAAAAAVLAALTVAPGVYNVVDDEPPTRHEVVRAAGERLGRRLPRQLPPAVVKRVNPASEVLMRSHRISNERFRTATGWRPDHAGADGLVDTMAQVAG